LLENEWIYEPYWQYIRGMSESENWCGRFQSDNEKVHEAISQVDQKIRLIDRVSKTRENGAKAKKDYVDGMITILTEVFMRLYTLRNQIFHGGITFETGLGRKQIKDGSFMMSKLVPTILDIMKEDIPCRRRSVNYLRGEGCGVIGQHSPSGVAPRRDRWVSNPDPPLHEKEPSSDVWGKLNYPQAGSS